MNDGFQKEPYALRAGGWGAAPPHLQTQDSHDGFRKYCFEASLQGSKARAGEGQPPLFANCSTFIPRLLLCFLVFVLASLVPSLLPSFLPIFLPSFLPSAFFLPSLLPSFRSFFFPCFLPAFLPSVLSSFLLPPSASLLPSFLLLPSPSFLLLPSPSFLRRFLGFC